MGVIQISCLKTGDMQLTMNSTADFFIQIFRRYLKRAILLGHLSKVASVFFLTIV